MTGKTVRVVVVDDSPTARMAVRAALETDPGITVVGEASNGDEAIRLTRRLEPNLVTMDVYLKSGDGIEVTRRLMAEVPTAVVVVTSLDASNPSLLYRAVEAGALEVMRKPPPPGSATYEASCRRLTRLVRTLAGVHVIRRHAARATAPLRPRAVSASAPVLAAPHATAAAPCEWRLLVIGASTGGPPAIRELLEGLPDPMPLPIALVQHMMPDFIGGFAEWLGHATGRRTQVVTGITAMQPGAIYIAPDDRHLEVTDPRTLAPVDGPPIAYQRPAVDRLFESAAAVLGARVLAVLLTGMGRDGALGMKSLCQCGAATLVQHPDTCAVPGMPRAAIELGAAGAVLSTAHIAAQIHQWLRRGLQ